MKSERSNESDLSIDRDCLDVEWENQSSLVFHWCEVLAEARLSYETTKSDYDVAKANCERTIRDKPEKFGITKLTEASVAAALTIHPKVLAAEAAVRGARHAVDVANAMVTALDHKKRALENLVQLHSMGYFSDPKARNEESEEVVANRRKARTRKAGR